MEEKKVNIASKRKSISQSPFVDAKYDGELKVDIGIGSLEQDMLSFLKTTEVSPKTAKSEEIENLKRDLSKSQNQVVELQEQMRKLKDVSRKVLDDFEHYKHGMELEKMRFKEAQFTIDTLRSRSDNSNTVQQAKEYLEKQVIELREEIIHTTQAKLQIEKLLEESRLTAQSFETQLLSFKSTVETESKTKLQLSSFNSEIGKELKQLTQAKKDLEISLQMQMEKYSRLHIQLSAMDTELIRVNKELEVEKENHKSSLEKLKTADLSIIGLKKQIEMAATDKEERNTEFQLLKNKFELLIGDLHVKTSEIEKLKTDVKYQENLNVQAEKQLRNLQDMLKRRAEGSAIDADVEINKILTFLVLFEDQKAAISADIKALINDKNALLIEVREQVKEYEVSRFRHLDDCKIKKPSIESLSADLRPKKMSIDKSLDSPLEDDIKTSKESVDHISNPNLNLVEEKRIEKESKSDVARNKTIRMLGEGSFRAKQLKNITMAKLNKKVKVVLFGGILQERADFEGKAIPKIVIACIKVVDQKGLKTEGIYRRAGAMKEMKGMQDDWEQNTPIDMSHELIDVLSVSSLLKAYFRDLKIPLIPLDIYESVVFVIKEPKTTEESLSTVRANLKKLLPAHYNTLYYLIQHLQR